MKTGTQGKQFGKMGAAPKPSTSGSLPDNTSSGNEYLIFFV